jgi:predicted metalloendopeptidase
LELVSVQVGFPDSWHDYDGLGIDRRSLLGNVVRAREFNTVDVLSMIGKPFDRHAWPAWLLPDMVNAFYEPGSNSINFPGGILQLPLFAGAAADAFNFGAIGSIIGHELTHGFDDQGSRSDGLGNVRDLFTAETRERFSARNQCVVDEYSVKKIPEGKNVDGELTLNENIADLGGSRLAWGALQMAHARPYYQPAGEVAGLNEEQQFFVRVNVPMSNMPEFAETFDCRAGDPMVAEPICRVW